MTRALGIAVVVTLGILAGCRGGPSARNVGQSVARAPVPESAVGRAPPLRRSPRGRVEGGSGPRGRGEGVT